MVDRAPELLATDLRNISSLINEKFFPNLTLAGRLARVANLKVIIHLARSFLTVRLRKRTHKFVMAPYEGAEMSLTQRVDGFRD